MAVQWTLRVGVYERYKDHGHDTKRIAGIVELRDLPSSVIPSRKESIRLDVDLRQAICAQVGLIADDDEETRMRMDDSIHELSITGVRHVVMTHVTGVKPSPTDQGPSQLFDSPHFELVRIY